MRNAFLIGVASLAVALLSPPALAATQLRHFEGTLQPVGVPSRLQDGGVMGLDVVFKDRHGSGKFTPRQLTGVRIDGMPLFCLNQPGQYTAQGTLTASVPTEAKFRATSRRPGQAKPKPSRYSYSSFYVFTSFAGTIGTRLYKEQGRGQVRAVGSLTVDHYDFPAPGPTNCSSTGPRGWSGAPCRKAGEVNPLPLCRLD